MNAEILLERLRKDMEMTETEYINFCRRYATRNIATVMWYMSMAYGKLPKGTDKAVKSEMKRYITIKEHRL